MLTVNWRGQDEPNIVFMVFTEAEVLISGEVRELGDKKDHHSSPEHNPESTRTRYSPESRRRSSGGSHRKVRGKRLSMDPSRATC